MNTEHIKILYITVRADFGGGPEHLFQIIHNKPSQWEVFVACPHEEPYAKRYQSIVGHDHLYFIPHRKFSIKTLYKLIRFVRKNGIHLLHSHGKGAGLYARLVKVFTAIPCIHTFHGLHIGAYSPFVQKLYLYYERCMSLCTNYAIAVSKGELLLQKKIISSKKLVYIPNGVIVPSSLRPLPIHPPYNIVSVTRFDVQKYTEFVIPIMQYVLKECQAVQCILIGDGSGKAKLEAMLKKNGLTHAVHCVGSQTSVIPYLQKAYIYLSTSRWEGLPIAVLEAMAYGIPVVATDVVGNNDAIQHEQTGLLYPLDDAYSASQALLQLINSPSTAKTLGKTSYEQARRFYSVEQMVSSLFLLYTKCLENYKE